MEVFLETSKYLDIETSLQLLLINRKTKEFLKNPSFWNEKHKLYYKVCGTQEDFISLYQQDLVLKYISMGRNIFITGQAGTGKSYTIRKIKEKFKSIKLCSSTGVSAFLIKASTFHSFFGIGTGNQEKEQLFRRVVKKDRARYNIVSTKSLIIDEVSMISPDIFDKVDYICKRLRNCQSPFGGIQLILVGDFFQLPPVKEEKMLFESQTWKDLNLFPIYFKKIYRQKDQEYASMLSRIRDGTFTKEDVKKMKTRVIEPEEEMPHIYSKKEQVRNVNHFKLEELDSKTYTYELNHSLAIHKKNRDSKEKATEKLTEILRDIPFPEKIDIKQGSRVMLKVNLDIERGLVNGSIGTVLSIDNLPVVKFDNGVVEKITYYEFEYEEEDFTIRIVVIPLLLAWAFTIHSVQGCTLEKAFVDITSCFTAGQAYVAISRVKEWNGLYLNGFPDYKVLVSEKVKKFYESI